MNKEIEKIFENEPEKVKEQKEKQEKYWTERNEKQFIAGEKEGYKLAKSLEKVYKETLQEIKKQINAFYGKYAENGQIDLIQARKLLSKEELKSFKKQLKDIIDYASKHKLDKDYINKMKQLNIKLKVSRLQELQTQINYELAKIAVNNKTEIQEFMENQFSEQYYQTIFNFEQEIGYSTNFAKLNTDIVQKAVAKNYNLANYSVGMNKVWTNSKYLMNILEQKIPQGLALGYNPRKLAKIVDKELKTRL